MPDVFFEIMNTEQPLFIVSAKRTPFGKFLGSLAEKSPVELATVAARAALEGIAPETLGMCCFGNVLSAGHGMNVARQIALAAGLPMSTAASTVNQMCASGMSSILTAIHAIRSGETGAVLCGGTESMSRAPRLLHESRRGKKFGPMSVVDSLLQDGLIDPSSGKHMALTAEHLAERYGISREAQDAFAWASHQKWAAAEKDGTFSVERLTLEEIVTDEQARPDTQLEKLAQLRPAFNPEGTITAANASGVNDGAAAIVVADAATCESHGWSPLARITGWAVVGCDPQTMGLGPVFALRLLEERHGVNYRKVDTVEINEAFAAQVLACMQELGIENVNPCGGAIAIGHPIGASGARLATHLAHWIASGAIRSGVASLCVGGGMGIALGLETA